jgi:hypothetical protein
VSERVLWSQGPDVIGGVGRKLSEFIAELGVGLVAQYAPGEL